MSKIAVVYWSGTGNTETMANIISQSATEAGAEVTVFTAEQFNSIEGYDAIAFGCPSMGSEELEETTFEPMFSSIENTLSGRNIALFGSYGWGDGQWMRDWESKCNDLGANVLCTVMANEAPDADAEAECVAFGKKIAG